MENLQKAMSKMEQVVATVNEGTRQTENIHKLLNLQNRFTTVSILVFLPPQSTKIHSLHLRNMCICILVLQPPFTKTKSFLLDY